MATTTFFSNLGFIETMPLHLSRRTRGDKYIWAIVIALAVISVLVVYSAASFLAFKLNKGNTEIYLFKQIAFMLVGLLIIYFLHRVNYTLFSRVSSILIVTAIPLLVYTLFKGTKINNGSRWIMLPIINLTFQTSDFARLALFMFISRVMSKKQDCITDTKKAYLPVVIPVFIVCGLIAPANLSTALLTGASSFLLMFIGRIHYKHLLLTLLIAALPVLILFLIAMMLHTDGNHSKKQQSIERIKEQLYKIDRFETWINRIDGFFYGTEGNDDKNYQVKQAKIAIANGGVLFGLGPGNSRQRNFLPHSDSDFIYAIIIEEYGLFGGAFILFVYLVFLFRGIRIFKRCPYVFGAFLALGLSFTLFIQAIAHMAVNVNLVPVTGVTLPLVSMGGTSFLFNCAAIGIILSVARNVELLEGKLSQKSPENVERESLSNKVLI